MIRVRITVASAIVRAGLASILADDAAIIVLHSLDDDEGDTIPDVVLTDAGAVDDAGDVEIDARGGPAIVVLLDHYDATEAGRLLRAGARGVVDSGAPPDAIAAAVLAAAAGLTVASTADAIAADAGTPVAAHGAVVDQPVTPRETEVLRLLAEGLGNKGIARRLGISEHTVKAHVSSILVKLGAGSRAEAVAIGARLGLILL